MDRQRREFIEKLWAEGRDFDAAQADRRDRRRNLELDSGEVLNVLVRALAPRRILEIGTSTGVSTLWIADAVEGQGAEVITVDSDPGRAAEAAAHLETAGLAGDVVQIVGDAREVLQTSPDSHWDVILLDAERADYAEYWPDLHRSLRPSGYLVVDNALSHASELTEFRAAVDSAEDFRSFVVPTGAGLLVAVKDLTPEAQASES
jgi:predicted O-methyltransferase YrrM